MTTSDWALIISLFSLLISMAGFVWNIWSKFIFPKPRVGASFMLMTLVGSEPKQKYLTLSFTNFGPGDVTIDCAVACPKKPWYRRIRNTSIGLLNPLGPDLNPHHATGPYAGVLPKHLAVGEEFMLYFPYISDMFMRDPLEAVGVHDSFRRIHWAPKRDSLKVIEQFNRDFPQIG